MAASFVHTELIHRSWDRLNAIFCVWSPTRSNVNDALPAIEAARTLAETHHGAIYDMSQTDRAAFLYPPIAAAIYLPHVAEGEGALWSLVAFNRLVFMVIALLLAAALIGPKRRWPTLPEAAFVASAMVLFLPMVRSLELNQASLYVALLVGAAWVALDRGALVAAGVFLGLVAGVKPHLFAVAPLLVFHARRTTIAAAVTAAALGAVSLAYAGWENHVTYATHVLPEAARGYAFFPNQSFGGLLHRLTFDGAIDAFQLMPRDPGVMRATLAVAALLQGAAFVLVARARRRLDLRREVLALAWLVTTMSAPIAWGHHYAAALFPLAWLIGRARDGSEVRARRLAAVAVGCALLGSYFVVGDLVGPAARLLASYGLFGAVLAAGAFAGTLATASLQRQEDDAIPRSAPGDEPIALQDEPQSGRAEDLGGDGEPALLTGARQAPGP